MTMTTREEFYENYGNVLVKFSRYYKYVFYYKAILPTGNVLEVGVGGDNSSIYKREVNADEVFSVERLEPFTGSVYAGDEEIDGFYDY